ncbi:hypothetical protein IMCC20628_01839 [Hoeflea sp. IMCC20628]|uniref:hypothetical protein n=1 Tax=Hoeflea sp. IMCC20628 TaxID=1620421 RepID=UPI00063AFBE5|nr:hypothetical protein [Hoeflea sp. IMCC20628]AKI00546.1 hypothetical protein IMCC20628_01839 [Hoeflea sp. IMCC20628]
MVTTIRKTNENALMTTSGRKTREQRLAGWLDVAKKVDADIKALPAPRDVRQVANILMLQLAGYGVLNSGLIDGLEDRIKALETRNEKPRKRVRAKTRPHHG